MRVQRSSNSTAYTGWIWQRPGSQCHWSRPGGSSATTNEQKNYTSSSSSSVEALHPTQHNIDHFGDNFYRPDDQTNSVKALKEASWSSRSGLNPTRTTPPRYNNTTLGNRLYAQRKRPNVTNPICLTCKNCSYKCAADCEHCVTQFSTELF